MRTSYTIRKSDVWAEVGRETIKVSGFSKMDNYFTRRYSGYTKAQAIQQFRKWVTKQELGID